ncbi:MAG: HAMP domain-containing histidine kinase [Deltaproteobacteria bacterium]|jgi:signal transduction histidine kinase|nr:HAMP domain-containing histidine kinase [Deltaproteobacteria bacterium]
MTGGGGAAKSGSNKPGSKPGSRPGVSWRPSLRLLLLAVNLVILSVPISGIYLFRVYENELVRQTESELISQAALVAAMFRSELVMVAGPNYGQAHWRPPNSPDSSLRIVPTLLDRSSTPVVSDPVSMAAAGFPADPAALQAASNLAPVLAEATLTTLSSIYLLDFRGVLVSPGRGRGLSLERNPEVSSALEGRYHSMLRSRSVSASTALSSASRDTPFRVFVAMPVFNGRRLAGVVYLSRTPRELVKALYQERWNLALAGASVLALMVVISLASTFLIISPVKKLAAEAARVAEDPGRALSRTAEGDLVVVREVADLRASVSEMAERLGRRSDYLKAFASGVSHEFKTPLASIKGAMELLGEHGRDMAPEVFQKFAGNMGLDLDRLERLVARLLALARAEALSPTGAEKCRAADLAGALAARVMSAHPGFEVAVEGPGAGGDPLELAIDRDVLETVLVNLLDNSRENGAGRAVVSLGRTADQGSITVSDDGPGLGPGDEEKIFTPFFTTRKNKGGTGLGLSLARTLLTPYSGRLDYAGPPAVFVVTAPLASPLKAR